jgi:hypothetical protein
LVRAWLDRREELRQDPALFRLMEEFVNKTLPANHEPKATIDAMNLALDLIRPHTGVLIANSNSKVMLFSARRVAALETPVVRLMSGGGGAQ